MVCGSCMTSFLVTPWKVSIIAVSILFSIVAIILLVKKKSLTNNQKLGLMYSHIFFLAFPFIFYVFYQGCQAMFSGCSKAKPVIIMLLLTAIVALIVGTIVGQLLFLIKMKGKSFTLENSAILGFISRYSSKMNIKSPKVYFVDSAKPFAFTYLKSRIFISIGMIELLDKKEIEAVVLHELNHLKSNSSVVKFSTYLMRLLSPVAAFSKVKAETQKEEMEADNFAIKTQKTDAYLNSAKSKINWFYG